MLNHVEGVAKVYEEKIEVFLMEVRIFYSIDDISDLSVCIFPWPKTFLCGGEDVVIFCKGG